MSSSTTSLTNPATLPPRPSIFRAISSSSSLSRSKLSPISKKNKPRLYLALYARGAPNTSSASNTVFNTSLTCPAYHWTWIVAPKTASRKDPGTCYQILHSSDRSFYEETDLSTQTPSQSATLLCRITLAKVLDEDKIKTILRNLPPSSSCTTSAHSCTSHWSDSEPDQLDSHVSPAESTNDCLQWIHKTYMTLFSPNHATNSTPSSKVLKTFMTTEDWTELEETARKYAKKKRNQGRFHYVGMGLNRGPGAGDGHDGWTEWEDSDIATWNFWERRETTA